MTVEIKTDTRRIVEFFLSPLLRHRDASIRERENNISGVDGNTKA